MIFDVIPILQGSKFETQVGYQVYSKLTDLSQGPLEDHADFIQDCMRDEIRIQEEIKT